MTQPARGNAAISGVELIRLSNADLDRPLYRIYPIWFFESALRTNSGNLALVPPNAWDDPHEDICSSAVMERPNHPQKSLVEYLRPTYAQCWSFEGRSDALLRAYSRVAKDKITGRNTEPKFEGVKVRTTPRRIINAVEKFIEFRNKALSPYPFSFYLAAIEYVDDAPNVIATELNRIGPAAMGQGWNRARSLTFKRKAFQHEQEVRLIAIAQVKQPTQYEYITVDINTNDVFEEIQFDPRLLPFERMEREERAKSLGYSGPIAFDDLYQKTFWIIPLTTSWEELGSQEGEAITI